MKKRNIGKRTLLSALALSIGATTSAQAIDSTLKDSFSLKEISNQPILIAGKEGACGEGKCGEGNCGGKKDKKVQRYTKTEEGKFVADKKGKYLKVKNKDGKFEYVLEKAKEEKAATEAKCGEGTCG